MADLAAKTEMAFDPEALSLVEQLDGEALVGMVNEEAATITERAGAGTFAALEMDCADCVMALG